MENVINETLEPIEITHVAVDEEGNEVKVVTLSDGTIQDAEYSDDPKGS
jgi:hypothetical protein